MEGKSPASNSLMQEPYQFDSVLAEWAKCLEGVGSEGGGGEEWTWTRIRWTDEMAKLLITAASYVGDTDYSDGDGNGSSTPLLLPKIGKWKVVSMALVQRGIKVSPQQCEDKFNDLNKKYKRLKFLLGSMSCKVIENPKLLGMLNLPGNVKEEVCRLLRSKQLLYQELCSYHNKNRLFLPHDRELQWQLMMLVRGENGELEAAEANDNSNGGKSAKRTKTESQPPNGNVKGKSVLTSVEEREVGHEQTMSRWLQLEEEKLEIQKQKMLLEMQKIKWLRLSQMEDWKLDKLRLDNEQLKVENACLALELKRQRMRSNHK